MATPPCPTCGANPVARPSNSERTVTLTIPERQFALMRATFHEMSTRLGMLGFGELANELIPYGAPFSADRDHLRFFDDRLVALAFLGVSRGLASSVRIGAERPPVGVLPEPRVSVFVDFTRDGVVQTLCVADNAIPSAAAWFKAYFEDAAGRMPPL
jgi:hypothetical protein